MEDLLSAKKQLVIVVTGCTGTGKTKLGIELAKKFNGEIISADSMQIYQGLDIITNTVTHEEMDGVVHHCINFISPSEQYNVTKYVKYTIPIIQNILSNDKIPIIVGGTAYYIEALLWDLTFSSFKSERYSSSLPGKSVDSIMNSDAVSDYEKLQHVDPFTAEKLHPNDTRKIKRSLEIFAQYGIVKSSLLADQHQQEHDKRGILRWDAVLLFSLECSFDVLDVRLDERVDKMVELGLCEELEIFMQGNFSRDSGLLSQVIGYKEFKEYIALCKNGISNDSISNALVVGLNKMKTATRRYARKQIRWIKNRLNQNTSNYKFIRLDTTNPLLWNDEISKPAHENVSSFIAGSLQFAPKSEISTVAANTTHSCDICGVICVGENSFEAHTKSRRHRKKKSYLKKKPFIDEYISSKTE